MFEYECPHCSKELTGSFGEDVYCDNCDLIFGTDYDLNLDSEGGENYFAWLTDKGIKPGIVTKF